MTTGVYFSTMMCSYAGRFFSFCVGTTRDRAASQFTMVAGDDGKRDLSGGCAYIV